MHSVDCHVERNDSQSGSKVTEVGSTTNKAVATMINIKRIITYKRDMDLINGGPA